METETLGMMVFFCITGMLCVGLSLPMIYRRVKPNGWYGFRTPKTLRDEGVWYAANAYMGRLLLVWGAAISVVSVLLYLSPTLRADLALYNEAAAAVMLGGLAVIIVLGLRTLRTL
jgi:uncharacterized membrane protein